MFASQVLELIGLGGDKILQVLNLLVNDFPVADVDKGTNVSSRDGNQS